MMPTTTGGMGAILPQYQGNYYDLQRQQMLAQALAQSAMQGQAPMQTVGSGGSQNYQTMPKASPVAGLSQIARGLMAAKLGGQVGQGYGQLGQQQWGALQQMMGGGQPQGGAVGQSPQPGGASADDGSAGNAAGNVAADGSAGGSGDTTAGLGVPQGQPQAPAPQMAAQQPQQGGSMNPLGMNPGLATMMYLNSPDKFFEAQAGAYKPADIVSSIRAAGIDPNSTLGHQLAQQALAKQNYIAPVSGRPGGYLTYPDGHQEQLPQVPEGFTAVQGPNGWQMQPVQGGPQAIAASSQAKASGPASYNLQKVWNGQTGQYEMQPATNVAAAAGVASPGAPAPIRNNNPGAMMPGGKLATYPDMQTGLQALDGNLQSYGKQGVNTIAGVIGKWAPPNENNTSAYISDVAQRLGIPANQQIDLSNPLQRQALSTAIALHENGPQGVFGSGPQAQGGAMAAEPPLGQTTAANASQAAPSKLMADSYGSLSTADANYQQSREALNQMLALANSKGTSGAAIGILPSAIGTKISPDAAEYQKLHATYVAMQGKALGSGGTDASRANIDESVPTYDKPQSAMVSGLNTQLSNLDLSHIKTQFLTPVYQAGNEKAYTQQSAAFDQNVTPTMVPLLTMPPGPQRAAALKQAVTNPQMKSRLDWAVQNGILK